MRVYIDTSVVGGRFDSVFKERTAQFWNAVINGDIHIIVSDILEDELDKSPKHVLEFFSNLPKTQIELVVATKDSESLAEKYIAAGVVGASSLDDCRHIAIATINRADVLVSLNFKHIVNIKRIHGYNGVNLLNGYPTIEIRTPDEVIHDET
jgi:predicted nucleic acid-binding protein